MRLDFNVYSIPLYLIHLKCFQFKTILLFVFDFDFFFFYVGFSLFSLQD